MADFPSLFSNFRKNSVRAALESLDFSLDLPLSEREKSRALHALDYALDDDVGWPEAGHLLDKLAPKMEQSGARKGWLNYLERGIAYCQRCAEDVGDKLEESTLEGDQIGKKNSDDREGELEAELSLHAGYLQLLMHEYEDAAFSFQHSQAIFQQMQERSGEGQATNRLAMVALQQGHYLQANELANKALALLPSSDIDRANSYYVLGTVARSTRSIEEALPHLEESLAIWRATGSKRKTAWGLRNLGPALRRANRLPEAHDCYEEASKLLLELDDPLNFASVQMNLGIVYSQGGDTEAAVQCNRRAMKIFKKFNDKSNMLRAHVNMGIKQRKLGNYAESERELLSCIYLSRELSNDRERCNAMLELWYTYAVAKQPDKAEKALHELHQYLDMLRENPEMVQVVEATLEELQSLQKSL